MALRTCNHCGLEALTEEDLELFKKNSTAKFGRSNMCKVCQADISDTYYEKHREARKLKGKVYYKENSTRINEYRRGYYVDNRPDLLAYAVAYRKENSDYLAVYARKYRKGNSEVITKYRINNPDKFTAKAAKRRAQKLSATPKWLTVEDYRKIGMLYTISTWITKNLSIQMHVDHIHPLQGKLVSGFHCPTNLQVIRAVDNLTKGNKFDIT